MERKAYPSDISDEEWVFVAPYLTLMTEETPQHDYERLPETLIGLHFLAFAILRAKPVAETMLIVHIPSIVTIT
jgi:hypothetical protein